MLETNIRIVSPGTGLQLAVRTAEVITQSPATDSAERACSALRRRLGLAAVVSPGRSAILVATRQPIKPLTVREEDWLLEVRDTGRMACLTFENPADAPRLAQLLERRLLVQIGCGKDLWTLDSPRIWYEQEPFTTQGEVAAYRRFEVSAIPIDCIGVGLVVDVSTAFFTVPTVADFFGADLSEERLAKNQRRFEILGHRQKGQKGTLLYDVGQSKHKCYFDGFRRGVTCATTGTLRVRGAEYGSLLEYYRNQYPGLDVEPGDAVAWVSFPGLDRAQPVAAKLLRLRVMNDVVPPELKQVDKICPEDRCRLIGAFWSRLGDRPLGIDFPAVGHEFWRPSEEMVLRIKPPDLVFGGGKTISAPRSGKHRDYEEYYRGRRALLDKAGCFHVPPAVARRVRFAVPRPAGEVIANRFGEDITDHLSHWTRKQIAPDVLLYDSLDNAFSELRGEPHGGVVVFVFEDEDPATYFTISHELKAWRVKRVTYRTLLARCKGLDFTGNDADGKNTRGPEWRRWRSFIELTALEVLQHLDCVPWSVAGELHYEAQLAIDVGDDRRYFALSLLIRRPDTFEPSFWLDTIVEPKADPQHETINEEILRDKIVALFRRAKRKRFDPIRSLLVLRDGRDSGREPEGIASGQRQLACEGLLDARARVDLVDFHKRSLKGIRLWDRGRDNLVRNALEGYGVRLGKHTAVLLNTGAAALHQGTAEPVMLVSRSSGAEIGAAASDGHAAAQLNYSNPTVAQRLPVELKRTDDELKNRAAQEIRRIK